MSNDNPTPVPNMGGIAIEDAYGALWLVVTTDRRIHAARRRLLSILDKEGQARGIKAATALFGAMTEAEARSIDVDDRQLMDSPSSNVSGSQDGNRTLPYDRDTLGRFVREAWVRWAETQSEPKPSWLAPYDDLLEADKEADRQIGEAVARWTLIGDAASNSLKDLPVPSFGGAINLREVISGIIEAWDFWQVNEYDREPPRDAISRARAALSATATEAE